MTAQEARDLLRNSATKLSVPAGADPNAQGAGLVDAAALGELLPDLRLEGVAVSPDRAPVGGTVTAEAWVENLSGSTLDGVQLTWTLRAPNGILVRAESTLEFQLTAGSRRRETATMTLPADLVAGTILDLTCSALAQTEWEDDPIRVTMRLVEAEERDRVVVPEALTIT